MADIAIHQLPAAGTLTGSETVPVDNGTATVRTTVGQIRSGLASTVHTHVSGDISGLQGILDAKAPLSTPIFTGQVVMPASVRVNQATAYQTGNGEVCVLQISQLRGSTPAPLSTTCWGNDGTGARINLAKSRGTAVGTMTAVNSGDELGGLYFSGCNGADLTKVAAVVSVAADGTVSSTSMPGKLTLSTTPSGSVTPVDRFNIDNAGNIGVSAPSSTSARVTVKASSPAQPQIELQQSNAADNWRINATGAGGHLLFIRTISGVETERFRFNSGGDLVYGGATTIIDTNGHLGLRSYTLATLPSAGTAARLIYVSDGGANKRLAVSDGSNWRWPDGAVAA
jgi:hypothetical protein